MWDFDSLGEPTSHSDPEWNLEEFDDLLWKNRWARSNHQNWSLDVVSDLSDQVNQGIRVAIERNNIQDAFRD